MTTIHSTQVLDGGEESDLAISLFNDCSRPLLTYIWHRYNDHFPPATVSTLSVAYHAGACAMLFEVDVQDTTLDLEANLLSCIYSVCFDHLSSTEFNTMYVKFVHGDNNTCEPQVYKLDLTSPPTSVSPIPEDEWKALYSVSVSRRVILLRPNNPVVYDTVLCPLRVPEEIRLETNNESNHEN